MVHIDAPEKISDAYWTPEVAAFAAHWRTLCRGALIPTSEALLDQPIAAFVSNTYIAELTSEGAVMRYQGAELVQRWMRDFTGHELHDVRSRDFKTRSLSNMKTVTEHPCGYLARLTFGTNTGRAMNSSLVQLPLAVKAGRPLRFVCYAGIDSGTEWQETVAKYMKTHVSHWLDIGAGVPNALPLEILQEG